MKQILLAVLSLLLRASKADLVNSEPHALEETLVADYSQDEQVLTVIDEYAQELAMPEVPNTCVDQQLSQLGQLDQQLLELQLAEQDEQDCKWRNLQTQLRYPKYKKKIFEKSCIVAEYPSKPYPSDVNTWKKQREWRKKHPQKWKEWVKEYRGAIQNATFYVPYEKDKCDQVEGKQSRYYLVEWRITHIREVQECPLEYPEHEEGTNEDDYDDEDNEYMSDDDQDDEDEDTYDEDGNIINISGKINPVIHVTHYEDTGEVPSPKKY